MKKGIFAALGLSALTFVGPKETNAQVNNTTEGVQHNIENVFKYQQNVDLKNTITFAEAQNLSQPTINIQEIKDLLKNKEFVNKFINTECVKELLKVNNLNKYDAEKMIKYILKSGNEEIQNLSQDTINTNEIKNLLNDKALIDKLANDEDIKALFNEYNLNEGDAEKYVQDILNSDFTIRLIEETLEYTGSTKNRTIGSFTAFLGSLIVYAFMIIFVPKKQNGTLSRRARTHIK